MVLYAINAHKLSNLYNVHFAQVLLTLTLPANPAHSQKQNNYAQPAPTMVLFGSVMPVLLVYLHLTQLYALPAQATQ